MKKNFKILFGLIFTLALAMVTFGCVNLCKENTISEVFAEETITETEELDILDFFTISQDGYVFKTEDFREDVTVGMTTYPKVLYTDQTVTISTDYDYKNYLDGNSDKYQISVNSSFDEALNHIQVINGNNYYVFDVNKFDHDFTTRINITVSIHVPKNGRVQAHNILYNLDFYLIQTKVNFHQSSNESHFLWKNLTNGSTFSEPSSGTDYNSKISLIEMPKGTDLNPIYIKFSYCGETYTLYNIEGTLYNLENNLPLAHNYLELVKSGKYIVEIYDSTRFSGFSNKNHLRYDFSITVSSQERYSEFYIFAHHEDLTPVANNQVSNHKTLVELVNINLSNVRRHIDRIEVTRTYKPSSGENIPELTVYKEKNPNTPYPTLLEFDEDGTYYIEVIGTNNDNVVSSFRFTMLQGIRTYFEIDGERYEMASNEPANKTKTFEVIKQVDSNYNGIEGTTTYSFNVTVARSAPAIAGVANNSRVADTVNLVIYGVGDIEVSISQDGKTTTKTVTNGTALEPITEKGDYLVKITDQMGTTVAKSFTIKVKLNTASMILIIIGIILVVGMLVFIVITRAKVKVK